jgi:hypothetical protein
VRGTQRLQETAKNAAAARMSGMLKKRKKCCCVSSPALSLTIESAGQ